MWRVVVIGSPGRYSSWTCRGGGRGGKMRGRSERGGETEGSVEIE